MSKTSSSVKDRWNKKTYDDVRLRLYKGQKEIVKSYAESQGKSLNGYISELIQKDMGDRLQQSNQSDLVEALPQK